MILDFKRTKLETNRKTSKTIFKKFAHPLFFLAMSGIISIFGI